MVLTLKDVRVASEAPWRLEVRTDNASGCGFTFSMYMAFGMDRRALDWCSGKSETSSTFLMCMEPLAFFFPRVEQVYSSDISEFVASRYSVSAWTWSRSWMRINYGPRRGRFLPSQLIINQSFKQSMHLDCTLISPNSKWWGKPCEN